MSKINDILDYVEETPHNTNRKLLKNMLTEFQESDNLTLPEVTEDDNGDVLMIVNGKWGKGEPITELPEVTSLNDGEVLTVVGGEWGGAQPSTGLPTVTGADNGKFLGVTNSEWGAVFPQIKALTATPTQNADEYELNISVNDLCELIEAGMLVLFNTVNAFDGDYKTWIFSQVSSRYEGASGATVDFINLGTQGTLMSATVSSADWDANIIVS